MIDLEAKVTFERVLDRALNCDLVEARDLKFQTYASNVATNLINTDNWSLDQQGIADCLLRISNIMYNDTTDEILPLDDGLYDRLLEKYKKYNPYYQIGAMPLIFEENPQNEFQDQKVMCSIVSDKEKMDNLYIDSIQRQNVPLSWGLRPVTMCYIARDPISKRLINVQHKYPELVGTLDKCKFVLNNDAREKDAFDTDSVKVFERDFIHKCLESGVISPTEVFEMVAELKYDGVSVEAEIQGDTIISALSRGDTADNIATDLTPILGGYKFPYANKVPKDIKFGMKFEAVMLKRDLERIGESRGKSYKNCRNAIIGLFGSSDAFKFVDYITLIPLSTSLDMPREEELKFINHFYNSGQFNRHVFIRGNYQQILFQVKEFTNSAEIIRKILPYMIDGVVISFTDPDKIKALGRVNSVNKYSMAIKFTPKNARTIFLGYTFNIGKSGDVIPMVHFKPCEFIGGIHTKQTLHSYQRFMELGLIVGQEIDIEYRNEVITYVTKPDNEFNRSIKGDPVPFIDTCPYCGSKIVISDSGKSAKCPNRYCSERAIARMTDMISRLGFVDFSEEAVRALGIRSFVDLTDPYSVDYGVLGPNDSVKFIEQLNRLLSEPIPDYKFLSAMGFDDMADEKWKKVLDVLTLKEIMELNEVELYDRLIQIKGVGKGIIDSIIKGRLELKEELDRGIQVLHIVDSKGAVKLPRVSFTGFRDPELSELLLQYGFDAGDYGVTNATVAVIAADKNEQSGKITKAHDKGIPVYTKEEFMLANNIKI
jgi:DNA ligase (NAD+)